MASDCRHGRSSQPLASNPRTTTAAEEQLEHELQRMGLTDIKFWKAVIISKPPGGPRLYWHQDCIIQHRHRLPLWQDPRSYIDAPGMIFLMYYLEDTSRHNGCLTPRTLSRGHPECRRG